MKINMEISYHDYVGQYFGAAKKEFICNIPDLLNP